MKMFVILDKKNYLCIKFNNMNKIEKLTQEINKRIIEEMNEITGIPSELYTQKFQYNTIEGYSDKRFLYKLKEVANCIEEANRKIVRYFELTHPYVLNKDLCYYMKKYGSIRKFKKAVKKGKIYSNNVCDGIEYIKIFKSVFNGKFSKKKKRTLKKGIKRLFKTPYMNQYEFGGLRESNDVVNKPIFL